MIMNRSFILCIIFLFIPFFSLAITDYEKCLSLTRDHPSFEFHVYTIDIKTEEALKSCSSALKTDPENPSINNSLARVYYALKDFDSAFKFFSKAYSLGYANAAYAISIMYYEGEIGGKISKTKYWEWVKKGAEAGSPWALYSIGLDYEYGLIVDTDYKKALDYYLQSAEMGHSRANLHLGDIYAYGYLNVEPNLRKAEEFYLREFNIGNPKSKELLAVFKYYNADTKIDLINAIEFVKELAFKNNSEYLTDTLYLYSWINLSPSAIDEIQAIYSEFTPNQEEAFELLISRSKDSYFYEWLNDNLSELQLDDLKSSDLQKLVKILEDTTNNPQDISIRSSGLSSYILGQIYYYGLIGPINEDLAKKYYELASNYGNEYASLDLGWLYQLKGEIKKSEKFFLRASKGNEPWVAAHAYNNLGVLYANFKKEKIKEQVEFYKKSLKIILENEFNLAWPAENLARIYIEGLLPSGIDVSQAQKYASLSVKLDGSSFYEYVLARNELTKNTSKKQLKEWYVSAILEDQVEGLIELAFMEEDENNQIEAVKWFKLCTFLCRSEDDLTQSKERIEYWSTTISGRKIREAEDLSRIWQTEIWAKNLRASNKIELVRKDDNLNFKEKLDLGNNIALLIGINNYEQLSPLQTPIRDVLKIGGILRDKYDFKIDNLENPTRAQILKKLNYYKGILESDDNFFIYYAGHGIYEEDEGFWLPKDADREDDTNWISNNYLKRKLKTYKSTNILVMADSCFSGSLTRGINFKNIEGSEENPYEIFLNTKSRIVISSGSNEPVFDGGGGGNSIFARVLIDTLNNYKKPFTSMKLYDDIRQKVMQSSIEMGDPQTPLYGTLLSSGHKGPDFVFSPNIN